MYNRYPESADVLPRHNSKTIMKLIYHLWDRGVDGRSIFIDDKDRRRFMLSLEKFNSVNPVRIRSDINAEVLPRQKLVGILAYTLLDNHFHLCIKELTDGGMTDFIRKLGTGYTLYFNLRHKRRGRLFERKIQHKIISSDRYFQHLIAYIHLNVLDSIGKEWRLGKLVDERKIEALEAYRWSSARAYVGNETDPLIDYKELAESYPADCFRQHKRYILDWTARQLARWHLGNK
jgi:REP element-mobilizing transposase RayT